VASRVDCAATSLLCLRFFRLIGLVQVLWVGGVLVGASFFLENTRAICRVASSIDCDIDRVSCWFGAVPCTLGTDWVLFGFVV